MNEKLVKRAIKIDRLIATLTDELKAIKDDLITIAEKAPESDRTETEGGGWSMTFESSAGIARVTQPGPKLKSSIDPETTPGAKIIELMGKWKDDLMKPELHYVPVGNFRERVSEIFTPANARRLLTAVTSKSNPKVAFETKDPSRN